MFMVYFGCFLLLLYYVVTKNHSYWASKGIPFEKPFVFFGNFFNIVTGKEHISQTICSLYNKYEGPYVGFFSFTRPTLLLRSPELIKQVLVKDFDKFTNRDGIANESIDPLTFHNLAVARDATWKFLRTKLSPVFTSGKMKLMFPLIKTCAEDLNVHLGERNGKIVEMTDVMKRYSVDVISSCAFGIDSNCLKNEDSEILTMASKLFDLKSLVRNFSIFCFFFVPRLTNLLRLTFLDGKSSDYFVKIFTDVLHERKNLKIERNDLIDILDHLKKNETSGDDYRFDDMKMAAQAILFFAAGNDTTSLAMTFVVYELALNEEIQNKLREEIRETFDKEGEFTYESVQGMKYLDMVLSETLRKHPLTPTLNRQTNSDYIFEETGLRLEKETSLYIPVSALHFDPNYFPDPEKFDPERFNDQNKRNIRPYTYLPFGEGPRNCIGQRFALLNIKVGLSYLIKDFALEPTKTTNIPLQMENTAPFTNIKNGAHIRVVKI